MGWSGGSYSKGNAGTGGWAGDASAGIGIEAGRHDTQDNDFATGINQCINKDGSNSFTANPNLGGFRPTNIAAGTAAAPALCVNNDTNTGVFGPAADTWAVATNGVERWRVDSNGYVGIGLTSAAVLVDAQRNANDALTRFRISNTNSGSSASTRIEIGNDINISAAGISINSNANTSGPGVSGVEIYNALGGNLDLSTNGTNRLRITPAGRCDFRNGEITIASSAITSGAGTNALRYSTSTGLVTYDTSSRLIKSNIEDCPLGLAAVLALKPRKYFRTDDQKNEVGFIADEVEQVVPEVVSYAQKSRLTGNEQDTEIVPSAVTYEKLTAVLCKAIQELNAKVTALENQLSATTVLP